MANKDYKAPLRGFMAILAKLLTQVAGLFTNKFKDPEIRQMAVGFIEATKKTVEVLSDANPDDKDQMRAIFNELLTEGPFKAGAQTEIQSKINELTNNNARVALGVANGEAWKIAALLTDNDPANSDQMGDYLTNLLRSDDGVIFLRSILGLMLKNSAYADTAAVLIIQLLLTTLAEEGDTETAARIIELQDIYEKRVFAA